MTKDPDVLTIDGDLDKSNGKIEETKSVIVRGCVKTGCEIRSAGDITVMGIVEDAVLDAGGNVEIKERFRGRGSGKVIAKNDVILNFAESQTIFAGNDVSVKDGIVHCQVDANNSITVLGNKGIIGGKVSAGNLVDIKTAGTATGTQTFISIGLDVQYSRKLERLEHDIHINIENTNKIVKSHHILTRIKLIQHGLTPGQDDIYKKLATTFEKLKAARNLINNNIDELLKEHLNEKAQIKIEKRVYPGVKLDFGKIKMNVKEEASKVLFQLQDGTIKAMRF